MEPLNIFAASDIADRAIASLRLKTGKAFKSGLGGAGCDCPYCKLCTFLLTLDEQESTCADKSCDGTCSVCQATYDELVRESNADHDPDDREWQNDSDPQNEVDNLFRALFHDENTCPICQGAMNRSQL